MTDRETKERLERVLSLVKTGTLNKPLVFDPAPYGEALVKLHDDKTWREKQDDQRLAARKAGRAALDAVPIDAPPEEVIAALQTTVEFNHAGAVDVLVGMIQRCHNPKAPDYARYGARGIRVCLRWRQSFQAFFEDMGPKPSSKHSIDRWPNNNGGYNPGNARWATREEQAANTSRSLRFKFRGRNLTLKEWARETTIPERVLRARLTRKSCKRWSVTRAFTTPIQSQWSRT